MKKRILGVVVTLAMLLSFTAIVADARLAQNWPSLSFSKTTATCAVDCRGNSSSDALAVTLTLRENGTLVAGWSDSGTGSVTLSKPYAATSGASYTLTLSYSINGVAQDPVSVSATCP